MNLAHFSVGSIGFVSHRSLARKSRLGLGFLALVFATSVLRAPPTGGTVVAGSATIATNQNTTTVTAGNNSVLSWGSFNVGSTEVVQFVQPGATARVLNWIGGSTPSQIDGSLLANGQVYLVNPAGVYFGQTAVVDVGQLYAIGGSLSKEDFLAGLNRFSGLTGDVRNDGSLQGSAVALVGARCSTPARLSHPMALSRSWRESRSCSAATAAASLLMPAAPFLVAPRRRPPRRVWPTQAPSMPAAALSCSRLATCTRWPSRKMGA